MSANINHRLDQRGITLIELIIVTAVAGMLIVSTLTIMLFFYGDVIRSNLRARLAVESQNILRQVVEDLRISSSIRTSNTIADANSPGGGWNTSVANLILIISTPALDANNNFIIDSNTGYPYQNEIVYHASGDKLYKRFLANTSAAGNRVKTSCPPALATSSCPADALMSNNFKAMNFVFYDQDDVLTAILENARSIRLTIEVNRRSYAKDIKFSNTMRITLRNNAEL